VPQSALSENEGVVIIETVLDDSSELLMGVLCGDVAGIFVAGGESPPADQPGSGVSPSFLTSVAATASRHRSL
jgi:hypothetical protein